MVFSWHRTTTEGLLEIPAKESCNESHRLKTQMRLSRTKRLPHKGACADAAKYHIEEQRLEQADWRIEASNWIKTNDSANSILGWIVLKATGSKLLSRLVLI